MKRVLSVIPAILVFCILGYGFLPQSKAAPATLNENFLVLQTPPPGGAGGVNTGVFYSPTPQGGLYPQTPQGGLHNYDSSLEGGVFSYSPFEGVLISYSPFEGGQGDVKASNPIKIGLLIQTNSSAEARNGASMAIDDANKRGGFKGRKFELVVKSMEGPWGTGSKQAVDMIFEDEVIAIVGSHDGRNAHLVEQATTKANISFLSAWAGDPTLSQAFTPWFFNCVPNDNQQAEILYKELKNKKFRKITLVTDDDYDAKSAFRNFIKGSEAGGISRPVAIVVDKSDRDMSGTSEIIRDMKPDCLILFTEPFTADKIICKLQEMKLDVQVFGPLSLLNEYSPLYYYPDVLKNLLLLTSGEWFMLEKSEFAVRYHERYKSWPGAASVYSFDAVTAVVNAFRVAGADKEKMQQALLASYIKGATGIIRFDDKGNRILLSDRDN
jgi:branched-chain amino acid transport system substrate-binding protein